MFLNTPISNKDKAMTYFILVQRTQFAKDTNGIFENKLRKGRTKHLTKKIPKTWVIDQRYEVADWNACINE